MLLQCNQKSCYSTDNHPLDVATNTVMCLECGKEVSVTKQTLATLKSMGQIKKAVKGGIQSTCKTCKTQDNPVLKKSAGKTLIAVCRKCGEKLDIHPSFIEAMKETGGYREGDSPEDRNLITDEPKSKSSVTQTKI